MSDESKCLKFDPQGNLNGTYMDAVISSKWNFWLNKYVKKL